MQAVLRELSQSTLKATLLDREKPAFISNAAPEIWTHGYASY